MPYSGGRGILTVVPGGYSGPGDILSGALYWYGLRAYNSAAAASQVAAIRLQRTDTTQADIHVTTAGDLNIADAFFNGSAYTIIKVYDQSGNGIHLDTLVGSPTFTLTGGPTKHPVTMVFASNSILSTLNGPNVLIPLSDAIVAKTTAGTTGVFLDQSNVVSTGVNYDSTHTDQWHFRDNTAVFTAGTITENVFHTVQTVYNGASSRLTIDGALTTGDTGSLGTFVAGPIGMGSNSNGGSSSFAGGIVEAGRWAANLNTGGYDALINTNQVNYWGP